MYQETLESIKKIDIYPIISLVIFVGFFAGLLLYLAKADKHHFDEVSQLPLQQHQDHQH